MGRYGDDWDEIYNIEFKIKKGKYYTNHCQNIMTFDIETSNGWAQPDGSVIGFDHDRYNLKYNDAGQLIAGDPTYRKQIDEGEPVSCLYVWQFAIEAGDDIKVFMGRTWDEFDEFLNLLKTEMRRQSVFGIKSVNRANENAAVSMSKFTVHAVIYVHNLGFEFQHLLNLYKYEFSKHGTRNGVTTGRVFARNARKTMKATMYYGAGAKFEFKDSLSLVNKSLKNWCKDEKLPVQKLEEPTDYYLEMRTPKTDLTDEEIAYSINDVVSMVWGLKKYRDKYGTLDKIPLTQTGEVRRKCREKVSRVNGAWARQCHDITTQYTPEEFKRLVRLFQGGWTHANKMHVGKTLKNIKCYDFASSYPAVMTTRTFPLGKFEQVPPSDFQALESEDINTGKHHWYAKIRITHMVSRLQASYWSLSKVCLEDGAIDGQIVDNGRIYYCNHMTAYMTDLDWDTFKQCYYFEDFEVLELYQSESGYLPVEMITTILEYFQYKTSLKGLPDSESVYVESKQFINSIYGVFVTKVITDLIDFNSDGWSRSDPTDEDFFRMINECKEDDSFTMYQAGVWVTAWARHNLFDFIVPMDKRVAYCDTDSIKGLFTDEDIAFVDAYNDSIRELEDKVAAVLGIDPALYTATTSKGKIKRLGVMERESDCEEFKTLGAKRYVDLVDGEIECTIAGLPKRAGKAKIKSVDDFNDGIVWDTRESEKLIARYNDNQPTTVWTDRDGHKFISYDKYGICLQPTTFDLSMGEEFKHFLQLLASGIINHDDEFYSDTPSWFFN